MISLHRNHDTAASGFVTTRPSTLDKIKKTLPSCSVQFDRYFVAEHKPFEPSPHHLVSQILFLFGRRNEMWVRVRPARPGKRSRPLGTALFGYRTGADAEQPVGRAEPDEG